MDPRVFQNFIDECYSLNWYSYTKRTFSGPLAVMEYLGRYTHRSAIANNRIVSVGKETVTIQVKDYKNNNQKDTVTMKGVEFIRRFLMHILPKEFVKNSLLWSSS
ncbi:transposase [Bacillus sp. FJAT-49705]|uniref:Transposase n=1 Tax=Cytobacillus citreus TaxID=2833586 RepID=A0ABS5NZX6_9BACI|nr:transposase [Cytobacillus citreus]